MSSNVHPNPGPIFPCSVCTGTVTWRGKSVQCCTCSKWVHLRRSQLSLSKIRALGSSHFWSCPLCRITVTPSSDFSDMYTSTVQSSPASAYTALSPHPRLQTSYPPSAHFISSPSAPPLPSLAPGFSSVPSASTPHLTLSGFFNGMLEIFEPGALNYFTFFRPILSTLSVSRGERLQGIAEDASSAPRLASPSAASFPGRNECPGTHCSLIERKEREVSSCQICHRV